MKIKLALLDDDTLLTDLLTGYFQSLPQIQVISVHSSAEHFLSALEMTKEPPDVLLLDLKLDGMDGLALAKLLSEKHSAIQIVALSSYYSPDSFGFLLKTGAASFLPKEVSPEVLAQAIESVHTQGCFLLPEQVALMRAQISSNVNAPVLETGNALSDREVEVLVLLAEQKTAKEIAEVLFVTQRTVEGHKNNLFAKTGAKNLAGLILYGVKYGFIDLENQPLL